MARPGRVVTRDVHIGDLYDTLTSIVGIRPGGATDGESFAACLPNAAADCGLRPSRQYSELYRYSTDGVTLETGSAALKRGNLKLQAAYTSTRRCLQSSLYNLDVDPYEQTDIQPVSFAATLSMRRTLERMAILWYLRSARGQVVWCS